MECNPLETVEKVADAAKEGSIFGSKLLDTIKGLPIRSATKASEKKLASFRAEITKMLQWCKDQGFGDEMTNAFCTKAAEEYFHFENMNGVLSFAQKQSGREPDVDSIDHSWYLTFRDHAKNECDEELQSIWAQLLNGELDKPGSYSKRTMSILADMSKTEAKLFKKLCGFGFLLYTKNNRKMYMPELMLCFDSKGRYNNGSFSVPEIDRLETLGLITTRIGATLNAPSQNELPIPLGYEFHESIGFVINNSNATKALHTNGAFTTYGAELSRLCDLGNAENIQEVFESFVNREGLEVKWLPKE